jgi:hypothetical protein
MDYWMADLASRSGLSGRTIRNYVRIKLVEGPLGHGPAARYSERAMLQAVCIARMRAGGADWDEVGALVVNGSLAKLRAYVKKTDPVAEAPPAPAPQIPSPVDPPALEAEPVARRRQLPPGEGARLDRDDAALPEGPRWVLVSLLPGMALMVRDDAAAVVRRSAAEIIERYGSLG